MGSYPYEQRGFSGSAELYTVEYRLFLISLALEMPLPWKSFFDKFGYMGHLPNLESRSEIVLDFTNVFVGLAQA